MKLRLAAVLEPKDAKWKEVSKGLTKAGLKVSAARDAADLKREQVVVIGPSVSSPSRVCSAARKALPDALVMAAQARTFKAAWADAVLPLPVSPNDLKVRLTELAGRERGGAVAAALGRAFSTRSRTSTRSAHFKEVLFVEVKRARRYGFPLAIALIGFDDLKVKPDDAAAGAADGRPRARDSPLAARHRLPGAAGH